MCHVQGQLLLTIAFISKTQYDMIQFPPFFRFLCFFIFSNIFIYYLEKGIKNAMVHGTKRVLHGHTLFFKSTG